ncbi:MAG: histidine kinase [Bacteroidia bacterium]
MYAVVDTLRTAGIGRDFIAELSNTRLLGLIAAVSLLVAFFWTMNILLVMLEDRFPGKRPRVLRYVISFGLGFVLLMLAHYVLKDLRPANAPRPALVPVFAFIVNNIIILILVDLVIAQTNKTLLELDKAHLEVSNLVASQKHLLNQIHPHFLFNALGTLKILINSDPGLANTYLGRLSNFLRNSISMADSGLISVKEELDLFSDYLELQRVRFREGIQYEIHIPDDVQQNGLLPVFSLQTLAENAIQHNGFSQGEPLRITLGFHAPDQLEVSNNLIAKFDPQPSTGTGLQNLSKRYRLLGLGAPLVFRDEIHHRFSVTLSLIFPPAKNRI